MPKKKREPTRNDFQKCAQVAHEYHESYALCELLPLLEAAADHCYLCSVGVWYWQLGHRELASACYRRSLEIHAEGPTYFNLAVCLDDMALKLHGDSEMIRSARKCYREEALEAIRHCYSLMYSAAERSSIRAMLVQNGKEHLAKARAKRATTQSLGKPKRTTGRDA